ncbi:MAG: 4Fe-4S dicluster domain-containing protein [Acidobacteria bacterium]|nr:4Fe-4S dicluster domain-containing protein [Acidobacteriota bacterium]
MTDTATPTEPFAVPADLPAHLRLRDCYQCGKCTAGCPVAERMDLVPNQILRLAQAGEWDPALRSAAIWQCVSCQTCSARCPKSCDCAGVMDALRQAAYEQGRASPEQARTFLFQKAFLRNIRRHGRLNELELVGVFKTTAFLNDLSIPFLFKDALLAPRMSARGKLHLTGESVRDRGMVHRIFDRCGTAV